MRYSSKKLFYYLTCAFLGLTWLSAPKSFAGGPFFVLEENNPAKWDLPVTLHPEGGACAGFSRSEMIDKIETNLSYWTDITGINLEFIIDSNELSGIDISGSNYTDYLSTSGESTDEITPIVFDNDGEIVEGIFPGSVSAVLGFASPARYDDSYTVIQEGVGLINCACLEGGNEVELCEGVSVLERAIDITIVHEIGHMLGFDHTQVNTNFAFTGGCDRNVTGDCDRLPVMLPLIVDPDDQIQPKKDDEVIALRLYGSSYLDNNFYSVSGTLLSNTGFEMQCVDVQAQTDDPAETIAVVTGAFANSLDLNGDKDTLDLNECASGCGDFILKGLDPTKDYTIKVVPIAQVWQSEGSTLNPCNESIALLDDKIVEETILNISAGEYSAGQEINLGAVTTESEGYPTATSLSTSSASGCQFNLASSKATPLASLLFLITGFLTLVFWTTWRLKKSRS